MTGTDSYLQFGPFGEKEKKVSVVLYMKTDPCLKGRHIYLGKTQGGTEFQSLAVEGKKQTSDRADINLKL